MRARVLTSLLLPVFLTSPVTVQAQLGCNRAKEMVVEARTLWIAAASPAQYEQIFSKMRTAADLCQTSSDAWKYLYCSAKALQKPNASFYRDRAVFNGVKEADLECGGGDLMAPPTGPLPSHVREKWALVVGIGKFKDSNIPTLQYTAKDAKDLAAALEDPRYGRFNPGTVTLLTDENATRSNILSALQNLFINAQEDDLVLLYVSSHGSENRKEQGLAGIGFIVTHDTSLDRVFVDSLEYQDLAKKVSMIKARRKVAFLDTCFSGQMGPGAKTLFIEGANVDRKTANLFVSGEGSYVVTSSDANEKSWESDQLKNSYFTHHLIRALKAEGDPPTVRQIFDVLTREVPKQVALEKKGAAQHPQLSPKDGRGDVRIGVVPLNKPPSP